MSTQDPARNVIGNELPSSAPPTTGPSAAVVDRLADWAAAGLIDAAQAERIVAWEAANRGATATGPASRRSVLVEALAYVGGAVIAAALIVATVGYWDRFDRATHLAIPAVATALLLVAGLAVPLRRGDVGVRVRATVWLVSVATLIALLVVLVDVPSIAVESQPRLVGAGAAIYALALWLLHRTAVQQAAAFGAVVFLAIAFALPQPSAATVIGAVTMAVSLMWGLAAWQGLLPGMGRWLAMVSPARQVSAWQAAAGQRDLGIATSAIGVAVSAVVLSSVARAPWVGVLPVLAILAAAIALGHVSIVVIGALSALIVVPVVTDHYLHSTLAVALVLMATGAVMVLLAVLIVRRRGRATPDSRAAPASGTDDAALTWSSIRSGGSARG